MKVYIDVRAVFPEIFSALRGWYISHYAARLSVEMFEKVLRQIHDTTPDF